MDHPDDHHHHDDHKAFPFEKVARLDAPERLERQPPGPAVEALELAGAEVVLDLGVGTGTYALPLAAALPEGRVLGADLEPRMLEILTRRAGEEGVAARVEAVELGRDTPALPLEVASVDRALLVNVYHELPDRPASLAELRRVLRSGGLVLVVDWDPDGDPEHGPPLRHRIPVPTATEELAAAGFTDVEVLPLYEGIFTLRARA